jgi:hypothetical protein
MILLYSAAASTFIAGILHLALIPMFYKLMDITVTTFFLVAGLAQIFWILPVVKKWGKPWTYVGIGGTVVLIIMYMIAVPGSGYPVQALDAGIILCQTLFIILYSIIVAKNREQNTKEKMTI